MSTLEPHGSATPPTDRPVSGAAADPGTLGPASAAAAPQRRRNPWVWVSVALALACAGLLVWGLNLKSERDDAQAQVKDLQAQISQGKQAGTAAAESYKTAYQDLEQQLGTTTADLAATEQSLKQAEQDAAKAQQDADAAKQQAAQAGSAAEKSDAEAAQAKAEAKAAESKTTIVTDCANAYMSALGSLLQSEQPSEQVGSVKSDLQGIADTCKTALGSG